MDFDRLKEFVCIAESGSIKKAAERLGITGATLSARMIHFEKDLGTKLFDRTKNAMMLTPAGEQLLPSALEILRDYRNIQRNIRAAAEHSYHHLRIAVCGTDMPLYLCSFLKQLTASNPHLELELLDDRSHGIVESLHSGVVDIYFAPTMNRFLPKGLSKNIFAASPQLVLLPQTHPLADRTTISIRDLEGECFLLYPQTSEPVIQDFQLQNLASSGISYRTYRTDTSPAFYSSLVSIGKGILLHPASMAHLPPHTVSLHVTDLPYPASSCFFYHRLNPKPDVQAFARDFLAFTHGGNQI